MIGTPIPIGFFSQTQRPLDEAYLDNAVAWASEAAALAGIDFGIRSAYMMVNIAGELYWFLPDLVTLEKVTYAAVVTALEVSIVDSADLYDAENVEDALAEVMGYAVSIDLAVQELATIKTNPYTLLLGASADVSTRLSGLVEGTDYPTGWTLAADSGVNLMVTHNLTGRKIASVNVYTIDGSNERLSKPFDEAFTGILGNGMTVKIEGLNTLAVPLRIELFFN